MKLYNKVYAALQCLNRKSRFNFISAVKRNSTVLLGVRSVLLLSCTCAGNVQFANCVVCRYVGVTTCFFLRFHLRSVTLNKRLTLPWQIIFCFMSDHDPSARHFRIPSAFCFVVESIRRKPSLQAYLHKRLRRFISEGVYTNLCVWSFTH